MAINFVREYLTDHEFSKWLFANGWKGKVNKQGPEFSEFVRDDGYVLAAVSYNNQKCTTKIWLNHGEVDDGKTGISRP